MAKAGPESNEWRGAAPAARRRPSLSCEDVADLLARCLARRPAYPSPDEAAVRSLTARVNFLLAAQWTPAGMAQFRRDVKAISADARALTAAAVVLARDLDACRTGLGVFPPDQQQAVETAIRILLTPRSSPDTPRNTIRISDSGPDPAPWALDAAAVAAELIRTLRAAGDSRAGIGTKDGPVVQFVCCFLHISMGAGNTPKPSTVRDAIANHLHPSFKSPVRGVFKR